MSFQDFMVKVRQWDNACARWMLRHFYILFFEFVLVIIFFLFLFNTLKTLDISSNIGSRNIVEKLLFQQSIHTLMIIFLLLLNSFWMLYVFNELTRLRAVLKDISFGLSRRKEK